jgi:hypothetical protein
MRIWAWRISFILLAVIGLFATEQSAADKAWSILQTGIYDKKPDKRVQAVSALGLIPGDPKAI